MSTVEGNEKWESSGKIRRVHGNASVTTKQHWSNKWRRVQVTTGALI